MGADTCQLYHAALAVLVPETQVFAPMLVAGRRFCHHVLSAAKTSGFRPVRFEM